MCIEYRSCKAVKISEKGLELLKHYEGCELTAYRCSADVLTIGYGHTKGVTEDMVITQEEADQMLQDEMPEYEGYINDKVTVELNQDQFDAMVCWVYNLGSGNLSSSTLLKVLNDGDYDGVPEQMKRWNKAGGKVLNGLIKRRDSEAKLFCSEEWL